LRASGGSQYLARLVAEADDELRHVQLPSAALASAVVLSRQFAGCVRLADDPAFVRAPSCFESATLTSPISAWSLLEGLQMSQGSILENWKVTIEIVLLSDVKFRQGRNQVGGKGGLNPPLRSS